MGEYSAASPLEAEMNHLFSKKQTPRDTPPLFSDLGVFLVVSVEPRRRLERSPPPPSHLWEASLDTAAPGAAVRLTAGHAGEI